MKSTRLLLTVTQLRRVIYVIFVYSVPIHIIIPPPRALPNESATVKPSVYKGRKAWPHSTRICYNRDTAYLLLHLLHSYLKVPVFTKTTSIYNAYYKSASICEPLSAVSPAYKALKNHLRKIASSHTSDAEKLSAPLLLKCISHLGIFNCSSK